MQGSKLEDVVLGIMYSGELICLQIKRRKSVARAGTITFNHISHSAPNIMKICSHFFNWYPLIVVQLALSAAMAFLSA